jgi:predicted O-methyltransferase YrrM
LNKFVFAPPPVAERYSSVVIGPGALARRASSPAVIKKVVELSRRLEPDEFTVYIASLCERGLDIGGADWGYMDLLTVLYAAAEMGQPENYLEIGVRRGRSAAMVAAACPTVRIVGFDIWQSNYAGSENLGGEFVREQLRQFGHAGDAEFVDGNSHQTVKAFFERNPRLYFDLITVDGDHSLDGARADLEDVIPHLEAGGVLVFDDTANPYCPGLAAVWEDTLKRHPDLKGFAYNELGTGVSFALRMQRATDSLDHNRVRGGWSWIRRKG